MATRMRENMPVKTGAARVMAPERKFRMERVSDPEAGMPPAMAELMFATPTESMSWFTST